MSFLKAISQIGAASRNFSISPRMRQTFNSYSPNGLEKRFLVWTGKYKSVADVPGHVSNDVMERCRNKIRIRVANIMMVSTIIGCVIAVVSGKSAAGRGETVSKQNIDWHKKYNEDNAAAK